MTTKKQRAMKAARAAKRIPIVGLTVVAEPLLESAAVSLNSGNFTSMAAWRDFFAAIRYRYTGVVPGSTTVDSGRLVQTYVPIVAYIVARKTGISKPISNILGKVGLKF